MLPQRLILKINEQGIDGSLRNKKDGYTYFGSDNTEEDENVFLIKLE